MKRGFTPFDRHRVEHGYTIVEVMVFLTVTSLLFVMIAVTFAGQRGRTQFTTAARDVESRLQDLTNDVSTGFYPASNFRCTESGGRPSIAATATPPPQGTNVACIFLGRVVQFRAGGNANRYDVYTVVGLRQSGGQDVANYDEARPETSSVLREDFRLPAGIEVASVRVNNPTRIVDSVGFFSTLGSQGGAGTAQESGSLSVNVLPLESGGNMINAVRGISQAYLSGNQNPAGGIAICLNSGTSSQHAILTLGGSGRQLSTDLVIHNGACS